MRVVTESQLWHGYCLSNDRKETNTKEVKKECWQFEVGYF